MSCQQKNKLRGWILLLVFSLNALAGFACSLGVDMGYNKGHHSSGAGHVHQAAISDQSHHQHQQKIQPYGHHHAPATPSGAFSSIHNDDCCANSVTDFTKLDKTLAVNELLSSPVFLVAMVSRFLLPATAAPAVVVSPPWHRRSWSLPDDNDLRIVMQSFQI